MSQHEFVLSGTALELSQKYANDYGWSDKQALMMAIELLGHEAGEFVNTEDHQEIKADNSESNLV